MTMRPRGEEWQPDWSQVELTAQELPRLLEEWRPEGWFREDQHELSDPLDVDAEAELAVVLEVAAVDPEEVVEVIRPPLNRIWSPASASPQPQPPQSPAAA